MGSCDSLDSQLKDRVYRGAYAGGLDKDVYAPGASAPRELRAMERLSGIETGVVQLAAFLDGLRSRLVGAPAASDNKASPPACGILDAIGRIEESLRYCHETLRKLDDAF